MRQQVSLLTRKQAAERLNVSVSTLRRLGRSGDIAEIRIRQRSIRIDPSSVDAYLARGRVPAAVPAVRGQAA